MADKIHCDLMEIFGPDWENITPDQSECLVSTIHNMTELFGNSPSLFGFVGTERIGNVVGGYFAIQYEEEEFHYDKQKKLEIRHNNPFARLFFLLFAETGKLLLQQTKFVGIPTLNMTIAQRLFREALDGVLTNCGLRRTIDIYTAPQKHQDEDFIKEFERSTRVSRLEVTNPNASRIPDDFTYYNPQRDRNEIIRDSHKHDYPELKKVNLEAKTNGDLRKIHARDIIYAAQPQSMTYYIDQEEFVMKREVTHKFEFRVDMKAARLPVNTIRDIIRFLRRERALFLDTPTAAQVPTESNIGQMSLFSPNKTDSKSE